MSLYRQPGRFATRTLAFVAAGAAAAGLAGGFALGRATAPSPSLAAKVADLRTALAPARQGVELTATEYPQAVRGGRVVAKTEYAAAKADVARARDAVRAQAANLRAVGRAVAAQEAIDALAAAIDALQDPAKVRALGAAADAALRRAAEF